MVVRIHNPISLFNEFENLLAGFPTAKTAERKPQFKASIKETNEAIVVNVELPGIKKEEVKVTFDNDVLTISAERKRPELKENEQWLRNEILYGTFERSINISLPVNSEKIFASHENGILHIVLPKAEEAKAKQIVIR
ncbi:MAG: Hsp20/alpha crystallin family protein [Bacteroidetes bacterium]|nr:Hsp20/alpha crystallin family protein [Bacteroidota bacterium]